MRMIWLVPIALLLVPLILAFTAEADRYLNGGKAG
jgi:hypothetical protein